MAPSCGAVKDDSEPPKLPIGVRVAETITTSFMIYKIGGAKLVFFYSLVQVEKVIESGPKSSGLFGICAWKALLFLVFYEEIEWTEFFNAKYQVKTSDFRSVLAQAEWLLDGKTNLELW